MWLQVYISWMITMFCSSTPLSGSTDFTGGHVSGPPSVRSFRSISRALLYTSCRLYNIWCNQCLPYKECLVLIMISHARAFQNNTMVAFRVDLVSPQDCIRPGMPQQKLYYYCAGASDKQITLTEVSAATLSWMVIRRFSGTIILCYSYGRGSEK